MKKLDTSWNKSAEWYDDLVESGGSYQAELILPNMLRLLGDIKNKNLLDLGCGQGFFARAFAAAGARVLGVDAAPALLALAEKKGGGVRYSLAPADNTPFVKDSTIDIATLILALQNIENMAGVFKEASRVLLPRGRLLIVLNHPAFRIPKGSSWGWDPSAPTVQAPIKVSRNAPVKKQAPEIYGIQYRRVDRYLSESRVEISMHPGANPSAKTVSFHRPLQLYAKHLEKNGFAMTRIEEWNSEKKSERGPRQAAEDRARKEFPLFLFIEARKLL